MQTYSPSWARLPLGRLWFLLAALLAAPSPPRQIRPPEGNKTTPAEPTAEPPGGLAVPPPPAAPPAGIAPASQPLQRVEPPPSQQVQGKTLYSFRAEDLDLKSALAMFARANKLNIVPDLDVAGNVTLDVQDLPLDRMMQALLEANDYTWEMQGGLIRVHAAETRTFVVDYLRMTREGKGASGVTLSSGSGQGGGGGMGGGGGFGGGGGGMGGAGGSVSGSMMNLKLENPIEFWKELEEQVSKLLTETGKNKLAVNMTAGVIQVTDRPSALRRVETYLEQLSHSVTRQVDIEAKIYDVTLNDQSQFGIDWTKVIRSGGGVLTCGGFPTVVQPIGEFGLKEDSFKFSFTDDKSHVILTALQEQGEVSVVSQPRLRTLNNQTAIMKVGRDEPFFTQYSETVASGAAQTSTSGDILSVITVGTVLSITPQVATNGWIALDISPAITSLVDTRTSPSQNSSAPVLDIRQTSTIVRVRDGETIVIGGLIQDSDARSTRKVPVVGDIPLLGELFRGRFHAKKKTELVVFLTPTIVR